MVIYIDKKTMLDNTRAAYFGYSIPSVQKAYVRKDLPQWVIKSVAAHEQQHLDDATNWDKMSVLHRESRAWWAGFKAHPIGFFLAILMSLTPSRIWLYVRRVAGRF